MWHEEGLYEHIDAVILYYFQKPEFLQGGHMGMISMKITHIFHTYNSKQNKQNNLLYHLFLPSFVFFLFAIVSEKSGFV